MVTKNLSLNRGDLLRHSQVLNTRDPAVDEAAKLYDISDWIGISVSTLTALILEKNLDTIGSNLLVKYVVSLAKKGEQMRWALNWIGGDTHYKCLDILRIKANLHRNDIKKYTKYKNTLDFYAYSNTLQKGKNQFLIKRKPSHGAAH